MATQRCRADEMEVWEVSAPHECVMIHGVVTEISPVKCSKKKSAKIQYFDGKLSDGHKTMWTVSFQPHLRSWLKESLDAATSVSVTDCQVKEGGFRRGLKIVAASKSKVGPSSPKKFKLPEDLSRIDSDASSEVHIEEIENLVHVKTMLVGVPECESDPASESEKVLCDCELKPSRSKKKDKGVTLN